MLEATARLKLHCDGRTLSQALDVEAALESVVEMEAESIESLPRGLEQHGRTGPLTDPRVATYESYAGLPAERRVGSGPSSTLHSWPYDRRASDSPALQFYNGIGGLNQEGEYQIRVHGDILPPAPWSNVIANPTRATDVRGVIC